MIELVLNNEPAIRLSIFLAIFLCLALAECIWPRRARRHSRNKRWQTNLLMIFVGMLGVRLLGFISQLVLPLSMAHYAQEHQFGLLNQFPAMPLWLSIITALLILDCSIYWQHRLFHAIPVLWRLHKVHHMDLELDVTSGNRFHPIEIMLSILIKTTIVLLFGLNAISVLLFEIVLNGMSQFNHSNISLGKSDALLRKLIVTPDFHITHHSTEPKELNSNFGFNLSCWDRMFGSYKSKPEKGYVSLDIGIKSIREFDKTRLINSLLTPFKRTNL
jgi:sterol desaturase/sphingolipid hydroxylase (fatty acid hydroxylase superfamily)